MAGWIKLHRSIVESDIYQMPPLYLRVFERMVLEANHKDNEIPYRAKGSNVIGKKLIRRGERLTSVRDISRWVGWYERGKLKEPNPKTVQDILDWLEENNMIEIYGEKGNRKETHYIIVNYNVYQAKEDEEVTEDKQLSNSQVTEDKQSLETNKNVKNEKNEKNSLCMYDEELKKVVNLFEQNIGVIPPILINEIYDYTKDFKEDMFSEAIKIASNKKKRTVNYVLGILGNWKENNILNINDLEALRKEKEIERESENDKKKIYTKSRSNKTRFHNFDQRSDRYSNDDLEKITERKRQEARGKMKGIGSSLGIDIG